VPSYDRVSSKKVKYGQTPTKNRRRYPTISKPDLSSSAPADRCLFPGYQIAFLNDLGPEKSHYRFANGSQKIYYENGAVKTTHKKGFSIINLQGIEYTVYNNGDMLQIFPDGATAYQHAYGPLELQFPNGNSIVRFPDGRREYRTKECRVYVHLPDGRMFSVNAEGPKRIHKPLFACYCHRRDLAS
jgi:hypothetical protein